MYFFNYILVLRPHNYFHQVYCHIFTGPASAMNAKEKGGSKNKARLFKITAVTGRSIAYACVQARKLSNINYYFSFSNPQKAYIALSGMKRWNTSDNLFYLDEFYDNIVSLFKDNTESPWVEETLNWWHE